LFFRCPGMFKRFAQTFSLGSVAMAQTMQALPYDSRQPFFSTRALTVLLRFPFPWLILGCFFPPFVAIAANPPPFPYTSALLSNSFLSPHHSLSSLNSISENCCLIFAGVPERFPPNVVMQTCGSDRGSPLRRFEARSRPSVWPPFLLL